MYRIIIQIGIQGIENSKLDFKFSDKYLFGSKKKQRENVAEYSKNTAGKGVHVNYIKCKC